MAGICTNHSRINGAGCDHRTVTVSLDGESFSLATGEAVLDAMPWGDTEKKQFILLGLKRLRVLGLSLDNAIGRVTNGEEATNVKQYTIIAPGVSITKTNIGSAYVDILTEANGCRALVDFTGCTEFRPVLNGVLPGTGPHGVRIVKDADNTVLFENNNIAAQAGERELDPGWQPIPLGFSGLELIRLQGKSTTAADDPIYKRCVVLVR